MLGARRLLRVGTCGALGDGLELGQLLAAAAALPGDGDEPRARRDRPARPGLRPCKIACRRPRA